MAKKKKPSTKGSQFSTQANLEAFVRYGGQLGELARMARDTKADAKSRASDAVAAGEAIRQTAQRATPELERVYNESAGAMNQRESNLRSELAKLGPAADPYKAGGIFSSTTAANRLQGEKASALRELVSRRTDAVAGARWGAQQARRQGDSDVAKIREKMMDVQAESGAFQAGRIGELTEAQRERANKLAQSRERNKQSDRNSRRSANVQRERIESQEKRDANKPKKGPKLQTPDKHYSIRSEIDRALSTAKQLQGKGKSRAEAARFLTSEIPDTKDGDTKVPGRKSNDQLTASIALDLAFDGAISRANVKRMHAQRLSLQQLGLADRTQRARGPRPSLKNQQAGGRANVGTR